MHSLVRERAKASQQSFDLPEEGKLFKVVEKEAI